LYLRIPPKNKKRGKKKSGGQSHGRRFHPLVARALGINQPSIMGDEKEVFSEREASMARSMLMGNSDTKVYTVVLGFTQTIGSNAGGQIVVSLPDSSVTSASYFSLLSQVFDEYRVVGVSVVVQPYNKYSKTTTLSAPIAMLHDSTDGAALTGFANASAADTVQLSNTDDMFPRTTVYAKSHSESANVWAPTSTSTVIGSIKWYADTLSATVTYGRILVHYKTEFRFVQ